MIPGMYPLYQVPTGRLFIRAAQAKPRGYGENQAREADLRDAAMVLGVVELPKSVELERVHTVRLNDALWMDADNARKARNYVHGDLELAEETLGHLLTQLEFSRGALPDAFEVFVRGTHLPHVNPSMRWAYVGGVVAQRPRQALADGIYELDGGNGLRLFHPNKFVGEPPDNVLRMAFWGPEGRYGLTTSMEPTRFPAWLEQERERQHKRGGEPMFLEFAKRMQQRMPAKLYYTGEEMQTREALTKKVLAEVMAETEESRAPSRRPRP